MNIDNHDHMDELLNHYYRDISESSPDFRHCISVWG